MKQKEKHIQVGHVAFDSDRIIILKVTDLFRDAIVKMSKKRLGFACIVDDQDKLIGVFTDGDLRRVLLAEHKPLAALFVEDIGNHMTENPKRVTSDTELSEAVAFMESADIYDLPVVDEQNRIVGLLHMHTALKYLLGL